MNTKYNAWLEVVTKDLLLSRDWNIIHFKRLTFACSKLILAWWKIYYLCKSIQRKAHIFCKEWLKVFYKIIFSKLEYWFPKQNWQKCLTCNSRLVYHDCSLGKGLRITFIQFSFPSRIPTQCCELMLETLPSQIGNHINPHQSFFDCWCAKK